MNRGQRYATLLMLGREMFKRGSWCGETHIQKGTYILQELLCVDTNYEFVLYKHGPFSFELRDDLSGMQADGLIDAIQKNPGYGPSYVATESVGRFLSRFPKTTELCERKVQFVAEFLGDKNVSELERLSTAFYVRKNTELDSLESRAKRITELKPHISDRDAMDAVTVVETLLRDASRIENADPLRQA